MNHPHVDNGIVKLLSALVSSLVEKQQNCTVKNYRSLNRYFVQTFNVAFN